MENRWTPPLMENSIKKMVFLLNPSLTKLKVKALHKLSLTYNKVQYSFKYLLAIALVRNEQLQQIR